jgi:hypothetical protein
MTQLYLSGSPAACAVPPTAPRCFRALKKRLCLRLLSTFFRCMGCRCTTRIMTESTHRNWCEPFVWPLRGAMA